MTPFGDFTNAARPHFSARPPAGSPAARPSSRRRRTISAALVLELDCRFPGLGRQIDESMAVAIDGEIFQDAYLAPLNPDSEIYLIPKIGGG